MTAEFADQTVVVTGATKGIGRAIAVAFANAGANVLATGRNEQELDSLCVEIEQAGSRAAAVVADLALEESPGIIAKQALGAFGRIDVLINNAAIIHDSATLVEFDPNCGSGFYRSISLRPRSSPEPCCRT